MRYGIEELDYKHNPTGNYLCCKGANNLGHMNWGGVGILSFDTEEEATKALKHYGLTLAKVSPLERRLTVEEIEEIERETSLVKGPIE